MIFLQRIGASWLGGGGGGESPFNLHGGGGGACGWRVCQEQIIDFNPAQRRAKKIKLYSVLISPVKLNFDLEQIATEFILMACGSTWVSK